MTERPIRFSGEEVRATLDGRKTQTRLVLYLDSDEIPPPHIAGYKDGACAVWEDPFDGSVHSFPGAAGAAVGDLLWVREAWSGDHDVRTIKPSERPDFLQGPIWYWADGSPTAGDWERPRPSIQMPRWASRITLRVTDVRVQRVQEISEEDAEAEGIRRLPSDFGAGWAIYGRDLLSNGEPGLLTDDPVRSFRTLWNALNEKRGYGWEQNPWVAAVSFERLTTGEHHEV